MARRAGRAAIRAATSDSASAAASVSMCAGVGEQRQRMGEDPGRHLGDHERDDQRQRGRPARGRPPPVIVR